MSENRVLYAKNKIQAKLDAQYGGSLSGFTADLTTILEYTSGTPTVEQQEALARFRGVVRGLVIFQ